MRMKRCIAACLAVALALLPLFGCMEGEAPEASPTPVQGTDAAQTPPPESADPAPPPLMSEEEYPRVDGSTATLPLSAALLSRACAIPLEEAELFVDHSTTNYAFQNLLSGASDLLLVYEPPQGAHDFAATLGKSLEEDIQMAPLGRDALVFLVNEKNPVRTLGSLQIQSIYRGETASWKDVGGEDAPILAFQRDQDSGSQTLMRKLVMQGAEMMLPPVEMVPASMGELVEKISEYDNGEHALGYSVYYYVRNMVDFPGLRMLAVDGVEPDDASIGSGRYPYVNDFYVAIRSGEPEGSPARILYDFLLGEEGQALVREAGYVPIEP